MKSPTLPNWHLEAAREICCMIQNTERSNAYRAATEGGYSAMPRHLYPEDFARVFARHDPATKEAMNAYEAADTSCPSSLPRLRWTV
jgi:hypothetical protein